MPASMKHSSSVLFIPHSVPITKLWLFVQSLSSLVHSWCLFLGLLTTALFPPVVQWQPDFWAAPGNSPWFPLAWLRLVSRGSRGESWVLFLFSRWDLRRTAILFVSQVPGEGFEDLNLDFEMSHQKSPQRYFFFRHGQDNLPFHLFVLIIN